MQKVFIAYRSEGERHAANRVRGALEASTRWPIECRDPADSGENFEETVRASDVLLVMVGPDWSETSEAAGPEDVVLRALSCAAEAGVRMRVALLEDSEAPDAEDLPIGYAALGSAPISDLSQENWAEDVADLIEDLAATQPTVVATSVAPNSTTRQLLIAAGAIGLLALLGGILVASRMWFDTPPVVGRWVAEVDYGRSVLRQERFEFRVTGGEIAGHASYFGIRRVIEGAVQDGERLSFHTRSHENRGSERRELRHEYVGIVAGDSIRFSLRSRGGFDERPPVEFEAQRE